MRVVERTHRGHVKYAKKVRNGHITIFTPSTEDMAEQGA